MPLSIKANHTINPRHSVILCSRGCVQALHSSAHNLSETTAAQLQAEHLLFLSYTRT